MLSFYPSSAIKIEFVIVSFYIEDEAYKALRTPIPDTEKFFQIFLGRPQLVEIATAPVDDEYNHI